MNTAWWTQQQSGLTFGVIGGAIGVLGGVLGVWLGLLARRGVGHSVAIALHSLGGLAGIAGLALAGAALIDRQPYHVWFPPLNLGLVCAVVFIGLYFMVTRRAYAMAQQRRLEAALLRGEGS